MTMQNENTKERELIWKCFMYLMTVPFENRNTEWEQVVADIKKYLNESGSQKITN